MSRRVVVILLALLFIGATSCGQKEKEPLKKPSAPSEGSITPKTLNLDELRKKHPEMVSMSGAEIDTLIEKYGEAFEPPHSLKEVKPNYPPTARAAGREGSVVIKAVVNKEGKVTKAEITRGDKGAFRVRGMVGPKGEVGERKDIVVQFRLTQDPELEKAALDAALQWTFVPAKLNGQPIEVWVTIPFRFYLK